MRRVLSLGAGIQSSALFWAYQKGILPNPPDVAIFADTQREPAAVMEYLKLLETKADKFPIVIASKGDLGNAPHTIPFYFLRRGSDKTSMGWRQCTSQFKIAVVNKAIRWWFGIPPRARLKEPIDVLLGISKDEIQRMKTSTEKWKTLSYPLINILDWNRSDCLGFLERERLPMPSRSACYFCPYRSNREWKEIKREFPEEFEKACQYDEFLRSDKCKNMHGQKNDGKQFVHYSGRPLREVDFGENQFEFQFGMQNECDGICGV